MKLGFNKTCVLLVFLLAGGDTALYAQKSRSATKPKPIVVVTDSDTCCCVTDRDPNKPLPTTVSGGILNNKASDLPKPAAVRNSEGRKLRGKVSVQVVIGEDGTVTSASGVSGDKRLMPAAELAAMRARFKPTLLSGNPVKVSGLIWYKF